MATAKAVLYTSKAYTNGKSPILLRVTKQSQLKYFKIGDQEFVIEPKQWNKEYGLVKADKRLNPNHEFLNGRIKEKVNLAIKIIEKFEEKGIGWTFTMFEQEYRKKPKIMKIRPYIESKLIELQNQGKYKTADTLKENLILLEKYDPKFYKLYFQDIDYAYIDGLYRYLKDIRKNKDSSIAIMMRCIRGILNEAINNGVGSRESYPFSKLYGAGKVFKIAKLEKKANKRFIPKDYMIKLANAEIVERHLNWARKVFLFSFFASGLNFKDMAFLSKDDIQTRIDDKGKQHRYIEIKRKKTDEPLRIPITDDLNELLNWAEVYQNSTSRYLLPIITKPELTGEKLNNHITQRRKRLNTYLKKLAKKLEFPEPLLKLSTYYARHSYATTLLRRGAQIEKISEALGHTNIKTTQVYLESFGVDEIARINQDLLK